MSRPVRVTLVVLPAYVDRMRAAFGQRGLVKDITTRLARLGFSPTLLVVQDPTDERFVRAIARSSGETRPGDDVLRVVRVEPVEEPPPNAKRADHRSHPFDPGLSVAEVAMVRHALAEESNPRHLWGLASTFDPSFPIAASLLRARKVAVEMPEPPPAVPNAPPLNAARVASLRAALDREASSVPRDVADEDVRHAAFQEATGEIDSGTPAVVRALARELVRPVARGVRIVDRQALLAACPLTGEEGFVSPSAIMLALATVKPEMSGVRSFAHAGARKQSLLSPPSNAPPSDVLRARVSMMRAQRAIERQRWIRWYERDLGRTLW